MYVTNTCFHLYVAGDAVTAWIKNSRTEYMKILKKVSDNKKSGSGILSLTPLQNWRLETFEFLKEHKRIKEETRQMGMPGPANALVISSSDSDDSGESVYSQRSSTSSLTRASSKMNLAAEAHLDTRPGTTKESKVFIPPNVPLGKPKSKKRLRESRGDTSSDSKSNLSFLSKVLYDNTNTMSETLSDLKEDNSDVRSSYMRYLKTEVNDLTEPQWIKFKRVCNTHIQQFIEERESSAFGVYTSPYSAQTTPQYSHSTSQMPTAPLPPQYSQYRPQMPPFIPHRPQRPVYPPAYPRLTTATATTPTTAIVEAMKTIVDPNISDFDNGGHASDTTVELNNSSYNSDA